MTTSTTYAPTYAVTSSAPTASAGPGGSAALTADESSEPSAFVELHAQLKAVRQMLAGRYPS